MVSIVTPVFNCAAYIAQTIQSVQAQTHSNWEMIIVDDNSTDNTVALIQQIAAHDSRITLLQNAGNLGPARSRNRAIKLAQGRYLTFLDGDDIWLPHFMETTLAYMQQHNCALVYGSYHRADENLQPMYTDYIVPPKATYNSLLRSCPISCMTTIMDLEKTGKFYMPDIPKRQDYGFWLSVLKKIKCAYGIQQPLAIYRIRKNSVSRNKYKAMLYVWKVYRDVEKLNMVYSTYLIINYTINGLLKYARWKRC